MHSWITAGRGGKGAVSYLVTIDKRRNCGNELRGRRLPGLELICVSVGEVSDGICVLYISASWL